MPRVRDTRSQHDGLPQRIRRVLLEFPFRAFDVILTTDVFEYLFLATLATILLPTNLERVPDELLASLLT